MANLAIHVDLRADTPTPATRHALGQARRIAERLGATCHAVVATGQLALPALERLATALGRAGADRVILSCDARLDGPPLWHSHGPLLERVAEHLRPRLFLFPAGTAAGQLAAPLAIAARALFFPDASVEFTDPAGLRLARRRADWSGTESLDVRSVRQPIVAVLGAGPADLVPPGDEAELELLPCPAETRADGITMLSAREDEHDAMVSAQALVWLTDAGTPPPSGPLAGATTLDSAGTDVALVRSGAGTPTVPNLDVVCPSRLCLASSGSLPLPPPLGLAARTAVILAGPRRPSLLRFPATFLRTPGPDDAWLCEVLAPVLRRPSEREAP